MRLADPPSKQIDVSVEADKYLVMSNAALADNIVSLDEYRRYRGDRRPMQSRAQTTAPQTPTAPAVWVYWVPVWVW
jgi:hypothetical protein